jgi:hypothetical protein
MTSMSLSLRSQTVPIRVADWKVLCRRYTKIFRKEFKIKQILNQTDTNLSNKHVNSKFLTWNTAEKSSIRLLFSDFRGILWNWVQFCCKFGSMEVKFLAEFCTHNSMNALSVDRKSRQNRPATGHPLFCRDAIWTSCFRDVSHSVMFDISWQSTFLRRYFCDVYVYVQVRYVHPATKKHEPSELNNYTFGDELTPLGTNSLNLP